MELKPIAHLGRMREIASVLFKYGFDDTIERIGIPGKELLHRVRPVDREMTTWERIRRSLEELGPTFIKMGQIVSLRPDLFPLPLIEELEKLQDE
ncbi:MAG TPA: ABC transporter, partial [Thermodesulfobacteriota bacterium]|nr:ABC transporter [Thermodesulfobacteriota bacterium]